jgi:hypothetical protein
MPFIDKFQGLGVRVARLAKDFRLLTPVGKRGTLAARLFDTSAIARVLA